MGPPVGSTPLRKLWATVQRVATSMRQITDRRCGSAPTRAYLKFLISRTRELFPTQRSHGSQILGRRHVVTSLLLRHSPSATSTSPSSASDHAILPDPRGPPELHPGRSGQTPVRADIPQGRLGPGALRPHPDPPDDILDQGFPDPPGTPLRTPPDPQKTKRTLNQDR